MKPKLWARELIVRSSKVVPVELIFGAAGVLPVLLAAVALVAARMPSDEIAHPLR